MRGTVGTSTSVTMNPFAATCPALSSPDLSCPVLSLDQAARLRAQTLSVGGAGFIPFNHKSRRLKIHLNYASGRDHMISVSVSVFCCDSRSLEHLPRTAPWDVEERNKHTVQQTLLFA
jgi:hypothetical protein